MPILRDRIGQVKTIGSISRLLLFTAKSKVSKCNLIVELHTTLAGVSVVWLAEVLQQCMCDHV